MGNCVFLGDLSSADLAPELRGQKEGEAAMQFIYVCFSHFLQKDGSEQARWGLSEHDGSERVRRVNCKFPPMCQSL